MSGPKRADVGALRALLIVTVVVAVLGLTVLSSYWQYVASIGAAQALIGLSIGIVYGQAGMLSLCQVSLGAVGAWTVAYVSASRGWLPLPWSLLLGAAISVPIGLLAGLPALRLRRVNLAIVTLGFVIVIFTVANAGQVPGSSLSLYVTSPTWGLPNYGGLFVLCWGSFALFAALSILLRRSRWGLSWLAISKSERAAAALGVSVPRAKLTAFVCAAVVAGWAGGLLVAAFGSASPSNFDPVTSLSLFALAVMMGAGLWEGALAVGFFNALSTAILRQFNLTPDIGTLLFAVGAVQVLGADNGGFSGQIRNLIARISRRSGGAIVSNPPPLRALGREQPADRRTVPAVGTMVPPAALELIGLSVRYGAVQALDRVDLSVPVGSVVGLVGPNGSGKSTLVDATTGFIASYEGSVVVGGTKIDALPARRRAQTVRRTFQQDRSVGELMPIDYLRLAAAPGMSLAQIQEVLEFVGCEDDRRTPLQRLDVRQRRLLGIGSCLVGRPKVVLLDEPGAGLSADESIDLGLRVADIPERFGCGVLVIEHDMEMVRLVCDSLVVLDFGKVIATGPTAAVLDDPAVTAAYLGVEVDDHDTPLVEPALTALSVLGLEELTERIDSGL